MKGHESRVAQGVAAHLYAQLVTIVTQLASLPLFMTKWSADKYGEWILLSAIPIYLTVADAGILTAAGNLMSMHKARNATQEVNRIFSCSLLIVIALVLGCAVIVVSIMSYFTFGLNLDERKALFFLMMAALLTVACGIFDAAYRPFGKYPRVTLLLTTARIVEWAGAIIALYIIGSLSGVALGFLLGRALACGLLCLFARLDLQELHWTFSQFDVGVAFRLVKGGVGFLSFPVGNLLMLQGVIVVIGGRLGGIAVAQFNTSRTLARVLTQLSIISSKALSPEISALHGAGRELDARLLSDKVLRTIVPLTVVGAILLAILAPYIIRIWSRGKIACDIGPLSWLLASAVASAYWQVCSTRLTATNRHSLLATVFILASLAMIIAVYFTANRFGIMSPSVATFVVDSVMVIGTLVATSRANLQTGEIVL